jgi:hypothetical protein
MPSTRLVSVAAAIALEALSIFDTRGFSGKRALAQSEMSGAGIWKLATLPSRFILTA